MVNRKFKKADPVHSDSSHDSGKHRILNALTIDVEDYFQVTAFESHFDRSKWHEYPSRVVENTRRLLTIMQKHDVRATFFVLGWVAEKFPELVAQIDSAGHEIGSHSYWHRQVFDLSHDEFRKDLCRSRDILAEITSKPVTSFRAPTFSITKKSLWALDILIDEGFEVDSSIFPIRHDRYGIPDSPHHIHRIDGQSGSICEFPMSVATVGKARVPASGGGYFRLYPYRLSKYLINRINRSGRPAMFYLHPWELDPQQPRVDDASLRLRWRHYVNLRSTEAKFDALLNDFSFGSLTDVVSAQKAGTDKIQSHPLPGQATVVS